MVEEIAREGGTPLVVARDPRVLGVIHLKDVVKGGIRERFDQLRRMGIRTIMITGDNRLTAAKIADEAGVDDFLAEATPEAKLELIKQQQADGRMVAMTGDGTNDAPALAQADVGVTMNTGTQAAREAGNMIDLDSNPTKLIEIVEVGKQLLITRGALTTFSIANDVAKYFAILPAMFAATYAAAGSPPARWTSSTSWGWAPRCRRSSRRSLQRPGHPAAGPPGPARGPLPPGRRQRAAAPQRAALRVRRPHRPLHRHQARRPHRPQPPGRLTMRAWSTRGAATTRCSWAWRPGSARPTACWARGAARPGGRDVVVGYLEDPRARGDRGDVRGLEVVPRRQVDYRGSDVHRDGPAGRARPPPELALVDELAHTNVPGAEHDKRWEDVEDVLDAGIDVFSTVNVQHLESLNDQVIELTGVRCARRSPTRWSAAPTRSCSSTSPRRR